MTQNPTEAIAPASAPRSVARTIQALTLPAVVLVTLGAAMGLMWVYDSFVMHCTRADRLCWGATRRAGFMVAAWLAAMLLIAITWSVARIAELAELREGREH